MAPTRERSGKAAVGSQGHRLINHLNSVFGTVDGSGTVWRQRQRERPQCELEAGECGSIDVPRALDLFAEDSWVNLAEHFSDNQILQGQCITPVPVEAVAPKVAVFPHIDQPHDHAHAANGAD